MSFKTKPFALDLPPSGGSNIVIVASSRSGKTTMLKYISETYFDPKKYVSVMFTMNPMASIYKDMSDKILVSDRFHPELLEEIHQINKVSGNAFNFCIYTDDFVDNTIKNSPAITRLLTVWRNANMNSCLSFQGRTLLNAVGRNNAHFIIIGRQNTPKEYEAVIKEFLSAWLPMGMTMAEMIRFVQEATRDFQFFVIDNLKGECFITKLSTRQAGIT